jgi:signal peptidase I
MKLEINFEKRYRLIREIIETVVLTVLMFLVINLAVQNFDVDGHSMEPRLHDQERVMVDKASYLFHTPARGDVVVFVAPPQPTLDYVKRIIAIPGDVISVNNGVPTVDGVTLKEFYLDPQKVGASPSDREVHNLTVPPGYYFVMGDNRIDSFDSRSWGLLPKKNIIGRAALVYWPWGQDNNGFLPNVSSVFANVHPRGNATSNGG